MKRRYCPMCDDTTNANICDRCGDVTDPWPCDGSVTDQFYQKKDARQRAPEKPTATRSPRSPQPDGSAHTPGPWRWQDADELDVYRSLLINKRIFAANNVSPGIVFGGLGAESDANARLIAAAPDLLAALRGMLRFYPHLESQATKAADAAIAKAEAH